MGYLPIQPPTSARQIAARAVADLARAKAQRERAELLALAKAQRERAELLAREPWRDPGSDCYDPLRVLREEGRAA